MARTYLFLRPSHLPLVASEMSPSSVLPLSPEEVRDRLAVELPALHWLSPVEARGEVDEGWVELNLQPDGDGVVLALRCSLRADYTETVQTLCDRTGWVAFDDAAVCYQPRLPPMSV